MSSCLVCTKRITAFWICAVCEGKYGRRVNDWPAWLRELRREARREQYRNDLWEEHEITFSDLEYDRKRRVRRGDYPQTDVLDELLYGEP